jgi:hypothetical protein
MELMCYSWGQKLLDGWYELILFLVEYPGLTKNMITAPLVVIPIHTSNQRFPPKGLNARWELLLQQQQSLVSRPHLRPRRSSPLASAHAPISHTRQSFKIPGMSFVYKNDLTKEATLLLLRAGRDCSHLTTPRKERISEGLRESVRRRYESGARVVG